MVLANDKEVDGVSSIDRSVSKSRDGDDSKEYQNGSYQSEF